MEDDFLKLLSALAWVRPRRCFSTPGSGVSASEERADPSPGAGAGCAQAGRASRGKVTGRGPGRSPACPWRGGLCAPSLTHLDAALQWAAASLGLPQARSRPRGAEAGPGESSDRKVRLLSALFLSSPAPAATGEAAPSRPLAPPRAPTCGLSQGVGETTQT